MRKRKAKKAKDDDHPPVIKFLMAASKAIGDTITIEEAYEALEGFNELKNEPGYRDDLDYEEFRKLVEEYESKRRK